MKNDSQAESINVYSGKGTTKAILPKPTSVVYMPDTIIGKAQQIGAAIGKVNETISDFPEKVVAAVKEKEDYYLHGSKPLIPTQDSLGFDKNK